MARRGGRPPLGIRPRGRGPERVPWLTIRQRPDLVHYQARIVDPARPDRSPVAVLLPDGLPDGHKVDVTDPGLSARLDGSRVMKQDRGVFDASPVSLLTTASVASLGAAVGADLDPQRFRPNVLIEAVSDDAFRSYAAAFRASQDRAHALVLPASP